MSERRCKHRACGRSLAGMRADAVWCSRACAMAAKRARRANAGRTRGSGPSGLQVSYAKVRAALMERFQQDHPHWAAPLTAAQLRGRADEFLLPLLSDAQRARLHARAGRTAC